MEERLLLSLSCASEGGTGTHTGTLLSPLSTPQPTSPSSRVMVSATATSRCGVSSRRRSLVGELRWSRACERGGGRGKAGRAEEGECLGSTEVCAGRGAGP